MRTKWLLFLISCLLAITSACNSINQSTGTEPVPTILPTIQNPDDEQPEIKQNFPLPYSGLDHLTTINIQNLELVGQLDRTDYKKIGDIDFSPDGTIIAVGHEESIEILSMPDGVLQRELMLMPAEVTGSYSSGILAFSPDGIHLASDSGIGLVQLWDVRKESVVNEYKGGRGIVDDIDFLQNGEILASAFDDPVVALERISDGEIIKDFEGVSSPIATNPEKTILAFRDWDDGVAKIKLYDPKTEKVVQEIRVGEQIVRNFSFNADGSLLATTDSSTITIWDVSSGNQFIQFEGAENSGTEITNLVFSPFDKWLLVSSNYDGGVSFWNVNDGNIIYRIGEDVSSMSFSPYGQMLITVNYENSIKLWAIPITK